MKWQETGENCIIRSFMTCTPRQKKIRMLWSRKEDEMGRACSTNGEKRNAYRILVGKPEKYRPLGRPRRKLVDNIKIDLRETG
jgi:hypothetical protein